MGDRQWISNERINSTQKKESVRESLYMHLYGENVVFHCHYICFYLFLLIFWFRFDSECICIYTHYNHRKLGHAPAIALFKIEWFPMRDIIISFKKKRVHCFWLVSICISHFQVNVVYSCLYYLKKNLYWISSAQVLHLFTS